MLQTSNQLLSCWVLWKVPVPVFLGFVGTFKIIVQGFVWPFLSRWVEKNAAFLKHKNHLWELFAVRKNVWFWWCLEQNKNVGKVFLLDQEFYGEKMQIVVSTKKTWKTKYHKKSAANATKFPHKLFGTRFIIEFKNGSVKSVCVFFLQSQKLSIFPISVKNPTKVFAQHQQILQGCFLVENHSTTF